MRIREMEVTDMEQVMSIERELFSVPWSENGLFSFLLRQDALFLVAEEKENILGFCGILMAMDEGDIVKIGVMQKMQGQGIGKKLLDALIRKAGERGVSSIYLEVRAGNQAAVRLYQSFGFRQTGIRKDYYEHPREDGITMHRS